MLSPHVLGVVESTLLRASSLLSSDVLRVVESTLLMTFVSLGLRLLIRRFIRLLRRFIRLFRLLRRFIRLFRLLRRFIRLLRRFIRLLRLLSRLLLRRLRGILMRKSPQLSLIRYIVLCFELLHIVPPAVLGSRSSRFLHDDGLCLRMVLKHGPLLSILCQIWVRKPFLGEAIPGSRLHLPELHRSMGGSTLFCFELLHIVPPAVLGSRSSRFLHDDGLCLRMVLKHGPLLSILCQIWVRKPFLGEAIPGSRLKSRCKSCSLGRTGLVSFPIKVGFHS